MNNKEKIAKLTALKESYAATQKKLASAKKLEESLRATNIGVLLEAELEQAEVILAAKDFATKLQKMAEELAKMQADSIPLGDSMKEVIGPDAAQDFENTVTQAIQSGLTAVRGAKDQITSSISRVEGGTAGTGDEFGTDMSADPLAGGDDLGGDDLGGDADADALDDVFGGAEASSGPADEPLGRGVKESYKSIGKKLLMKESLDSLVNWLFEDVATAMPAEQFPKFAGQIAMKGAQDSERLAGWIGKRKYGPGLGAQLSSPLDDMDDDILDEGKSYKRNDDEEVDVKGKKKADADKRDASKAKREIEEGKSYKHDDEEEVDVKGKKKADAERKAASKTKRDIEEGKSYKHDDEEEVDVAGKKKASAEKSEKAKSKRNIEEAVRLIIERNIAKTGKGFAAKAIAEAQSMFPMVESSNESIVEAFTEAFGMTPVQYSVKKARAIQEAAPLNPQDKKNAASSVSAMASEMSKDKNLGEKPAQSAMSKMDPQQRATAQKIINTSKAKGKEVKKVSDLVDATNDAVNENINAANWPVNSMGQYKGEPFQTDHNKLKADKTSSDSGQVKASPKGADAPKSDTPWDGGNKAKAESPKTSDGATASTKPAPASKEGAKNESEGSDEQKD
jgi:hypothetical protein